MSKRLSKLEKELIRTLIEVEASSGIPERILHAQMLFYKYRGDIKLW